MSYIGSIRDIGAQRQATTNVFTGRPCNCGHGGVCNCPSPAAQSALPYLAVPRDPQPVVRTELDILRERNAALEARLAAMVAAQVPGAAQPMREAGIRHALTAWPGSGGVDQRTGMPAALVRGLR